MLTPFPSNPKGPLSRKVAELEKAAAQSQAAWPRNARVQRTPRGTFTTPTAGAAAPATPTIPVWG